MKIARLSENGDLNLRGELVEVEPELRSGRNLLKGTNLGGLNKKYNHDNKTGEGGFYFYPPVNAIVEGKDYVFSVNIRGNANVVMYMISTSGNSAITFATPSSLSETDFRNLKLKFRSHRPTLTAIYVFTTWRTTPYTEWFEIEKNSLKIEKGSEATSWSPAPEDSNSNIPNWVESAEQPFSMKEEGLITHELIEIPDELVGTGGRNVILSNNISVNLGSMDKTKYLTEGVIKYNGSTSTYYGARFTVGNVLPNTKYVFSYSYKKTAGTLVGFGGHVDATYGSNSTYVDGKSTGTYSETTSAFVKDDTEIHNVTVFITTPNTVSSSHLIYIQPNRGSATSANIDIYNLKMEIGKDKNDTPWSPAPEDLGIVLPDSIQNFDNPMSVSGNGMVLSGEYSEVPDALSFNGTSGYVSFPIYIQQELNGKPEATVEFWCKKNTLTGDASYGFFQLSGFKSSNGNLYTYNNPKIIYLDTFKTSRFGPITLKTTAGDWHHFAVTTKSGVNGWCLYQNGELVYSATGEEKVSTDYTPFTIGVNSGNRYAHAYFKDVRIWSVSRTINEIRDNMSKSLTGSEPGLLGYWRFDDGYGGKVTDYSPNANHGTIVNGVNWIHTLDTE